MTHRSPSAAGTPPGTRLPADQDLARVWITVVFAILTVAGVLVVAALGIQRARQAEAIAARAEIATDATILLRHSLFALQEERTMAEMWLTEPSRQVRRTYVEAVNRTDQALEVLGRGWRADRPVLDDAGPPTLGDVEDGTSALSELRAAALRFGEESSVAAYSGVVEVVRSAARRTESLALESSLAPRVRALVRIMEAEEALAQQRDVVLEVLSDQRQISQDDLIRVLLLEQEARTNLGSIRNLGATDVRDEIGEFLARIRNDEAQAMLTTLRAGQHGVDGLTWHAAATERLDALRAIGGELETTLMAGSDGLRESAEVARIQWTVGLAALFIVSVLAGIAAVRAAHERSKALYEHGELARGLVEWFDPARHADLQGVKVAGRYEAASEYTRAGGDWYDVYQLSDRRIAVTIGDVAGHGSSATAQMAQVRHLLRGIALGAGGSPAMHMRTLDEAMRGSGTMATVFHGLLDIQRGELVYVRAGHLAGLVRTGDTVERLDAALGSPVGVESVGNYTEATVTLTGSSQIVLFTDGLVEERGVDIEEALAGVATRLAASSGDVEEVADRLIVGRADRDDDAALLVLSWEGVAAGARNPTATQRLDPPAASAPSPGTS